MERTVITPPSKFKISWRELWQYRELFYFFTWRDIKVKYKQTYLGLAWAVLQPLALMFLFTFIFSGKMQISTGNVRYEVFLLSGLVLWNLFNSPVTHAADSIIQQSNIIRKIYFPRLLIPFSSLLTALFDFVIVFLLFLLVCLFFRQPVSWNALLFFPAAILLNLVAAFGLGSFLSALNVKYRDFRYVLGFTMQFLFFASQVIYPISSITRSSWKYLLAINPVNAVIEIFRIPLTGNYDMNVILIGMTSSFVLLVSGIYYFRKTEAYFADIA